MDVVGKKSQEGGGGRGTYFMYSALLRFLEKGNMDASKRTSQSEKLEADVP